MSASPLHRFTRIDADGACSEVARELAIEAPIAIEINGFNHAVLMATPQDLADLAYGFLFSERLIESAAQVLDIASHETPAGWVVRIAASPEAFARVGERVRHRTSDSSCGLCGVESLEQALRPLPRRGSRWHGSDESVFVALRELDAWQALNRATGATHAAARCTREGSILAIREDVGRHNAFDKLIGAMLRGGEGWDEGFALLTSRCSYELVEKAALSDCPMLATISAATDLAVSRAAEAGVALRLLARPDALLADRATPRASVSRAA